MGRALDELSSLTATVVGASMATLSAPASAVPDSLPPFLSACLDQMVASVTLINGRLPLDCSEEALGKVAKCVYELPATCPLASPCRPASCLSLIHI